MSDKAYLEIKDIEQMEQSASCMRDKLLIKILFRLGCRVSEALGLTVNDIDLKKGTVTILHLKFRSRILCSECGARLSKNHGYCPQCGIKIGQAKIKEQEHRKTRTLPIDTDTLAMLRDYIQSGGPIIKASKKYIFGINRHRAWQVIRDAAQRAGLPALLNPETGKFHMVSPHRLRDAFAVHAVKSNDSGDGLRLLQEHLGHASFNTTARYRKVAGEEHRRWYDKLWEGEK
jgi:integrase/recombinase XerD